MLLEKRAAAFVNAATEVNLEICPFSSGFFVTVPCENADEVGKFLQDENVFAVPIGKGVRFAISAVSEEKCAAFPAIMVDAIQKVNG